MSLNQALRNICPHLYESSGVNPCRYKQQPNGTQPTQGCQNITPCHYEGVAAQAAPQMNGAGVINSSNPIQQAGSPPIKCTEKNGQKPSRSQSVKTKHAVETKTCVNKQNQYDMDYIPDKCVYRAVMLARWLIRERGENPFQACKIAAYKYRVDRIDVHHYVSQTAGRVSGRRKRSRKRRS